MAQALVPLKALVNAKTRLAGLLSPDQRQALVAAMAEDVLTVLAGHPGLHRVVLVSDDPGAPALARRCGVEFWPERGLGERGLNGVVTAASDRLTATSGGSYPLLVLHADLPLLSASDIDEVLALQAREGGLVVCCDRAGTGTNLLAFAGSGVPQFSFGADSCAAHTGWARSTGVSVRIVRRLGSALDVDTAGDLTALLQDMPVAWRGKTGQLLRGGAIRRRIEQVALSGSGCAQEVEEEGEQ